ncbi:MAG: hypothetical protein ACK2U9_08700, partial [Anaerolineae bacterium]
MVFRARPNQLGFGLMIPATGLSVLVQMGPTPGGYLAAVVYMVLAIPVVLALVGLVFLIGMSRRANRSVLTRHTVTLDATGVLEETAYGRCEAYWTGVDRIVDSGGYVYVF